MMRKDQPNLTNMNHQNNICVKTELLQLIQTATESTCSSAIQPCSDAGYNIPLIELTTMREWLPCCIALL